MLAGPSLGDGADGKHNDVYPASVRLLQRLLQMFETIGISHGDENVTGPDLDCFRRKVVSGVEAEFLQLILLRTGAPLVVFFGELECDEERYRERETGDGGHFLRQHINDGQRKQG